MQQPWKSHSRRRSATAPRRVLAGLLLAVAACAPGPELRHPPIPPETLQEGVASWYGGKFAGRPTASGEVFDPKQLTAASRVLPFGAVVRVTNLHNGRYVDVRINDRGPFKPGRILDCSEEAARQLGYRARGTTRVAVDWPPAQGMPGGVDRELWILVGVFEGPLAAREVRARALALVDAVELHRTGRWVRVHAGPFTSRSNAELALAKLRQAGFLATLVTLDSASTAARGD